MPTLPKLETIAAQCQEIIGAAERDGLTIDDGNVVDLCADNLPYEDLETIRHALVVAGLASRFPNATSPFRRWR